MTLKNIFKKYSFLFIILPLLALIVIVVAIGEESKIMENFFGLHYLFALAIYFAGLREIANPIRLGWGTTRKTIYIKFNQKIVFMISLFIIIWLWLLLLLTLKNQTSFFTFKIFKELLSLLVAVFLLSELGLLFGNIIPFKSISTILGIILFFILAFLHSFLSILISLIIALIASGLVIVNYRLVRNINILRFYK